MIIRIYWISNFKSFGIKWISNIYIYIYYFTETSMKPTFNRSLYSWKCLCKQTVWHDKCNKCKNLNVYI